MGREEKGGVGGFVTYVATLLESPEVMLSRRPLALFATTAGPSCAYLARLGIVGEFVVAAGAHDDHLLRRLGTRIPREPAPRGGDGLHGRLGALRRSLSGGRAGGIRVGRPAESQRHELAAEEAR